jgi:hypothetical protein
MTQRLDRGMALGAILRKVRGLDRVRIGVERGTGSRRIEA